MNRTMAVKKLIDLAGSRIDIFYHAATNTHIVCQKSTVAFYNAPIKGTADFADDAHQKFLQNIESAANNLNDLELNSAIALCQKQKPSCTRKFELPIAMREDVSARIKSEAKKVNMSLSLFLENLINDALPIFHDSMELTNWAEKIKESSISTSELDNHTRSGSVATPLPLTLSHRNFERASQIFSATRRFNDINQMLGDLVTHQYSQKISESKAHSENACN